MVDQATANMIMKDIMGYDIPSVKTELPVNEARTVEITDSKLHKLIEGKSAPGVSSSCVLEYLKLKEQMDSGEVSESASPRQIIERSDDETANLISDMLGSM